MSETDGVLIDWMEDQDRANPKHRIAPRRTVQRRSGALAGRQGNPAPRLSPSLLWIGVNPPYKRYEMTPVSLCALFHR